MIAVHFVNCRAGNEDPSWDEAVMYYLNKAAMEEFAKAVGDEKMTRYNEWWSYQMTKEKTNSGRPSKKDCIGGKELLKNKHEAQFTKSVGAAVSILSVFHIFMHI